MYWMRNNMANIGELWSSKKSISDDDFRSSEVRLLTRWWCPVCAGVWSEKAYYNITHDFVCIGEKIIGEPRDLLMHMDCRNLLEQI